MDKEKTLDLFKKLPTFSFFLFCDHSYTCPFHASTMTNLCLLALPALMRISFGSRVSICTRRSIGR